MALKKAFAAASLFVAAMFAAGPAVAQRAESVAAIVNDDVISTYDVRQRAVLILVSAGIDPSPEALNQVRGQALRSLVDEHLQMQEAKRFKIEVKPEEIDQSIVGIARSNRTTPENLRKELAQVGVQMGTLRDQIAADLAWRRLVGARFGTRVRISQAQIDDTLSLIAANAAKPQYLVSEIYLPVENESQWPQAEVAAKRLIQEIQKGAPFQAVARQFSGAPSAASGGDLGWLAQSELNSDWASTVIGMQPNQMASVRAPNGVFVLALRDKRAGIDQQSNARLVLRQVSAPAAEKDALARALARLESCAGLEKTVSGVKGAEIVDLGDQLASELAPDVAAQIANVAEGRAAAVSTRADKAGALVVCKRVAGGGLSRSEVEDRLYEQEIGMLSQRYLRNVRRESTIITRMQ